MLVSLHNVHVRSRTKRPILAGITLELEPGAFVFLTGPSGAGKSSLLRVMGLALRPTTGSITLLGHDVATMNRRSLSALRRRLGFVLQDSRLIPHLTAIENASLPLWLAGGEPEAVRRHVTELLTWVGLGDRLKARPAELSGGEQQRVALARAIVNKPALLLADEPTGNVDDQTALKLLYLFTELNKMGTTVVIATHQHHLVARMGKTTLAIQGGVLQPPPEGS